MQKRHPRALDLIRDRNRQILIIYRAVDSLHGWILFRIYEYLISPGPNALIA